MKQLKSTLSDLHDVFDRGITIREIAEPVVSFDDDHDAQEVKEFMAARDYDYLTVRSDGYIAGYAVREEISSGRLGDSVKRFEPQRLISDLTPLREAVIRMRSMNPVFVSAHEKVWGIVTKGDLQKFPVRMWLFGVLSIVEMQMLRLVRQYCPKAEWPLKPNRIADAKKIFEQRLQQNQEIDIEDCLQWCDKAGIIAGNEGIWKALEFRSKGDAQERLARMERLRNLLAHANDMLTGNWPKIIDVIEDAERLLNLAERIPPAQRAE